MVLLIVISSILSGALSAGIAAVAWDTGLFGTFLAYWLGGMSGTALLVAAVALRIDDCQAMRFLSPNRNATNRSRAD